MVSPCISTVYGPSLKSVSLCLSVSLSQYSVSVIPSHVKFPPFEIFLSLVFICTSPKETFTTGHHYILILNNELDGPKEFTNKTEYLSSAAGGIDAEINYVGSSTNQEFQAYCEQEP